MKGLDKIILESIDEELYNARNAVNTNPTDGQKKAGNYKMGHININGYNITIENPKGSYRSGKDKKGKEWRTLMNNDYGYFTRTKGKDGDAIDVFIGNDLESKKIFAVDQKVGGKFDETKVMFCFNNEEQAKKAYLSNYKKDWKGFWKITEVSQPTFRKWLYDGYRQRKPFFQYNEIIKANKKEKDMKKTLNEAQLENIIKNAVVSVLNESEDESFMGKMKGYGSAGWNTFKNYMSDKKTNTNKIGDYVKQYDKSYDNTKAVQQVLKLISKQNMPFLYSNSRINITNSFINVLNAFLTYQNKSNMSRAYNKAFKQGDKYKNINDYPSKPYAGNNNTMPNAQQITGNRPSSSFPRNKQDRSWQQIRSAGE